MPLIDVIIRKEYTTPAGTIICPHNINVAEEALRLYTMCNVQTFNPNLCMDWLFLHSMDQIYQAHNQKHNFIAQDNYKFKHVENNKKVLVAFSGGLDSMYQVIYLLEHGYDVYLYHVANINYYTNGKEKQICQQFATEHKLPLIISTFKQNTKKDNDFKKYWKENSFKNILIYSMMLDYCLQYDIHYISCGDDLRLDIKDAVVGTNIADAKQVTTPFAFEVGLKTGVNFIFVNHNTNKAQRLEKLLTNGCIDEFYSCVNPGRFNQSNHNRIEQKYHVHMEKYNCGVCRKCAFHSLLRHYYLNEPYNKEFIDFCWQKIAIGADYEFFKPTLPLETRINNLITY